FGHAGRGRISRINSLMETITSHPKHGASYMKMGFKEWALMILVSRGIWGCIDTFLEAEILVPGNGDCDNAVLFDHD
ncbi:MAG: hypothetical protein VXZ35_08250, partial [Pseudomonadota bacterium]|nr:hypothetical protein [Pseudomonadota bacterium]